MKKYNFFLQLFQFMKQERRGYQILKKIFALRTHQNSLSYTGVIIWNALPENIKSSETFTKLKNLYNQRQ